MSTGETAGRALCAAVDVHYLASGSARAAVVLACDETFSQIAAERTTLVPEAASYVPGRFFLRELPPIRAVLAGVAGIGLLIVDGYVDLSPDGRPGLGAYAHAEFGVSVIGVAKSAFRTATHAAPVLRGRSARPLFVTAAGIALPDAARLVHDMAGDFRVPSALRRADALARRHGPPPLGRPACPHMLAN